MKSLLKNNHLKLTAKDYALLTWSESRAKELLGAHTGGPHELCYKLQLMALRQTLRKIKQHLTP
jgi:hypothetical protein